MLRGPLAHGWGWEPASAALRADAAGVLQRGAEVSPPLPSAPLQKKLQDQRQYIVAEFEQARQFLRERERHLLDQLTKLEQELAEGREKYKSRGVGELARLALLISELEAKAQQPAAELLQVRRLPRAARSPSHHPRACGTLGEPPPLRPRFSLLKCREVTPTRPTSSEVT